MSVQLDVRHKWETKKQRKSFVTWWFFISFFFFFKSIFGLSLISSLLQCICRLTTSSSCQPASVTHSDCIHPSIHPIIHPSIFLPSFVPSLHSLVSESHDFCRNTNGAVRTLHVGFGKGIKNKCDVVCCALGEVIKPASTELNKKNKKKNSSCLKNRGTQNRNLREGAIKNR